MLRLRETVRQAAASLVRGVKDSVTGAGLERMLSVIIGILARELMHCDASEFTFSRFGVERRASLRPRRPSQPPIFDEHTHFRKRG